MDTENKKTRTSITLDPEVLAAAKRAAILGNMSVSQLTENALRKYLCETEGASENGTTSDAV